ncbi:MAG: alpha-galactosidase [Anaerolineae bacterium]
MKQSARVYTDVTFRSEAEPGVRYTSGLTIYDEMLLDGELIGRYWSPSGQIRPETHLTLERVRAMRAKAPMASFRLALAGEEISGGWQWVDSGEMADPTGLRAAGPVRVVYILLRHTERPVEVRVCTRLDGSPFLVRWLEITNTSDKATAISAVSPMAGQLWAHRYDEHLPAGSVSPYELAYTRDSLFLHEGDMWYKPLTSGTTTFDGGLRGGSGWGRPAFWARDLANGQTFVCELAWSGNWQFGLDCRLDDVHKTGSLGFSIGPATMQKPEVLRVMVAGEMVRTPLVHIGHFQTDTDSIVQALHHHVRHTVLPEAPDGRWCEIEANHRGYLCDRESEPGIKADIDVAAAVGAEMYVIDAGWYGNLPNQWWNNTGDWFAGSWLPNGLEPIPEYAHGKGMKFGLWAAIEAVGSNTNLQRDHPEWLMARYGVPVNEGHQLDFSKPEVEAWAESEIARMIQQYQLDMYRIDDGAGFGMGGTLEREGFTENVLWRYYEALYRVFDHIRARFPHVALQNCGGGGGRLDLGIMQRFHNTELSDWLRQPRFNRIINGLTMSLPPEIGLRTFGTEVGEHVLEASFDSQLRLTCLGRPIFRGISPSMAELNPLFKERIGHTLELFRSFIRPVMHEGLVFHHTPWLPISLSAPWVVWEYATQDRSRALVTLFRTDEGGDDTFLVRLRGLDHGKRYRVTWDNGGDSAIVEGFYLMNEGLRVTLPDMGASELVLCEAVAE